MPAITTYRRVLLDLRHATSDRGGIRAAAELARLLDLDLTGVFIEDTALLGLSEYSFARELRLPGHEWHPLDPQRLAEELRGAAATAQRLLDEHCAALGIPSLFERVRGDPVHALTQLVQATDILVETVSVTAAERLARAGSRGTPPAKRSAATLLVPPRVQRHRGPVAVVVTCATDPGLLTAAAIAAAAAERLLLLLVPQGDAVLATAAIAAARHAGLSPDRIQTRRLRAVTPEAVLRALDNTEERLLVLTRDDDMLADPGPQRLAVTRQVPVLVVASESGAVVS